MTGLAEALARRGHKVVYIAEEPMSADRKAMGWEIPSLVGVDLKYMQSSLSARALVKDASPSTIHITQGFRSNGLIADAQAAIGKRGDDHFIIMETVPGTGAVGLLKRLVYRVALLRKGGQLRGVLAIGHETPSWLKELAPQNVGIFPFAYFLAPVSTDGRAKCPRQTFRVLFVGQLLELKRLDWLISALGRIKELEFELVVVGAGPLEADLKRQAGEQIPGRAKWLGRLSRSDALAQYSDADCLVLPSRRDGWGAVVSEALMAGTPVICSSACGSAGVVRASRAGGVFETGRLDDLVSLLSNQIARGRINPHERSALSEWATCLGADAGAEYLEEIVAHREGGYDQVREPWKKVDPSPLPLGK